MDEPSEAALTLKIEAALHQVARKVVEVARQTRTPVIVWKDGRVHEIASDQLDDLVPTNRRDAEAVSHPGPVDSA